MRTTLNFPDMIIHDAKLHALREGTTLTALMVQGLRLRIEKHPVVKNLPVSGAAGGIYPKVNWISLSDGSIETEGFR